VSGIAGIIQYNGAPVAAAQLNLMLTALQGRGPQSTLTYLNQVAGLGQVIHRHAPSAVPQSLPLVHPSLRWALVLDGRLDNREELLNRLNLPVASPGMADDGHLVLAAYEKWGQDCPQYLIGDFVLAVWDCQERSLFCARDHFGVKPFYYFNSANSFLFATNPDAILATRSAQHRLNEVRIADFMLDLEGQDTTSTFYEAIYRLPHGHALLVKPGDIRLRRYWQLAPAPDSGITSPAGYVEIFTRYFSQAVRCRLGNPAGTGVALSGGLDSSAVFGIARQIQAEVTDEPLTTFSFISPNDDNNQETRHIQALLNPDSPQAHTVSLDQVGQSMDTLVAQLENAGEPFDWHMNIWRVLYDQAFEYRIHSVLDGVDGDLLLADSNLAPFLWRSGQIRAAMEETLLAEGLMRFYYRPWKLLLDSLRAAFLPDWLRRSGRKLLKARTMPNALRSSIILPEFARLTHLDERLEKFRSYSRNPNVGSQMEAHRAALSHPHLQAALERYYRVASACSIEPLHPLLDVRLVEFCLGLPWQLKTRRGWTKMAMRQMMEPLLPAEVVRRKDKHHLGWSVNNYILKTRADHFRQILEEDRVSLGAYIHLGKVDRAWKHYLMVGGDAHASLLWDAVALAFWLRRQKTLL